jgi:hypothetical protein
MIDLDTAQRYNEDTMNTETYYHTRSEMSAKDLRQYDGKWVAFSADGTRIIAADESLVELDKLVVAAGEDPEIVGFERVELEDSPLGGAELL